MTLRHLQIFAKVCEHESMSAAAADLFISQSAVSQAIRELENKYDLSLFTRDKKKLRVTHAGEKLLLFAQRMLELSAGIDQCMRETKLSPELRLGVTSGVAEYYLPDMLRRYRRTPEASQVVIHCEDRQYIEQALLSSELDLALVEGELSTGGFQMYPLFTDTLQVVCAENSRLSPLLTEAQPELDLRQLFSLPLMLPARGTAAHSSLLPLLRQWDVPLHLPSLFSSTTALCDCVRQDLGVGILPSRALTDPQGLKLIRVRDLDCPQPVFLVHHQKRFLFRQLRQLLDFILEDARTTSTPTF